LNLEKKTESEYIQTQEINCSINHHRDTQETPLVIDEDNMLLEVQIKILIEEIMVVNNVT
jgi:hypothetical protein